jgi:hypothetical protein
MGRKRETAGRQEGNKGNESTVGDNLEAQWLGRNEQGNVGR